MKSKYDLDGITKNSDIAEYFGIDEEKVKEMRKSIGIPTVGRLSENNIKVIVDYGHKALGFEAVKKKKVHKKETKDVTDIPRINIHASLAKNENKPTGDDMLICMSLGELKTLIKNHEQGQPVRMGVDEVEALLEGESI